MRKKKVVYISGPMSGHEGYRERFRAARELLEAEGFEVVNPAEIPFPEGFSYEQVLEADLSFLEACDAVYMLDGWEGSKGARVERKHAMFLGIRLIYEKHWGWFSELLEIARGRAKGGGEG